MANFACFNPYHDAVLVIYDGDKNKFIVFDIEKIYKNKHHNMFLDLDRSANVLKNLSNYREQAGVTSLDGYIFPAYYFQKFFKNPKKHPIIQEDRFHDKHDEIYEKIALPYFRTFKSKPTHKTFFHNESHAACGYYQSPFRKAVIFSHDAGGDGQTASLFTADINCNMKLHKHLNRTEMREGEHWKLCNYYNNIGRWCDLIDNGYTHREDVAGKFMGLSAYGKEGTHHYNLAYEKMFYQNFRINTKGEKTFQEQADQALGTQKAFEDVIMGKMEEALPLIEKHDNNLVIVGGGAMNILLNAKIQETWPQINLFVPPNPADDGLPLGAMLKYLHDNKHLKLIPRNRPDFAYGGLPIQKDAEYSKTETTLEEVAELLNDGKIIGVIQGTHELGKRALGNRSILANASLPDMKDRINKIKNREFYRPFAPMCRLENAEKYFDAPHYNNLRFMNVAVKTRPEYKKQLESITHEDDTARLQTLTRYQNALMYDLLGLIEGDVLLNTSFNVAGQPILNTVSAALKVLHNTPLDKVLMREGKNIYFIE